MKINVREARSSDVAAITEIFVASWQSTYADIIPGSLLNTMTPESLVAEWTEKVDADQELVYVAETEEGIIGFAHLGQNLDEDLKEEKLDLVELHALYFHPSSVNQGLGSEMWGILEEGLIGKLVVLWTLEENRPAHHFYIKHGFEQDLVEGKFHFRDQSFPKLRYRKLIS
ncbi:MAG: GNAT family N-acetyltransferase [Verrucomicrobia bacterium]|nr:GNAT family N-acetyltransferase [Verrucomicrobiota bacterium]